MFDAAAAATASEVASEQVAQEQAESAVSAEGGVSQPTAAETESQEVLQSISTFMPAESRHEVAFVDPTVPNYQELLRGMDPNIEVILLDGGQDGVEQMASALAGRSGIDAIHLISHGNSGELQLGTGTLNLESMDGQYASELWSIQQALSEQADILVYGCDFAEGEAGEAALSRLAELTGADVQASNDLTGNASLGGDWDLELKTGSIETRIAIDVQVQADWMGLLAAPTLDATKSPTLNAVSEDAGAPSGAAGTLVSSLVDFANPAGQVDNVTDPDAGAQLGIAITAANTTNGTWWYSTNNGSTWNALGAVSEGSARLLAADANTRIYFQGNADYNGTMSDAITFRAWDQTSGTAGSTADLTGAANTVKDQFSSASYNNNNGTANWNGNWVETDSNGGGASGGRIQISGGQLDIRADSVNDGIYRQANLSNATSATLSFSYNNSLGSGDQIAVQVSSDGGASYTTLSGGVFSNTAHTGSGTISFDISSAISANTQVRFLVTAENANQHLYVDNVQISYVTSATGGTTAFSTATDTASLVVTAVNDAPTITSLSGDSLAYSEGAGAVVIEQGGNASVSDVDSTNFDTGTLTISIPSGGDSAEDVLGIRNQGTGAGQIGVSGSNVTYQGVTIGTFTGGSSGSNLVITLNSSATPTAVTALVKNITYQNTDTNAPTTGARTVRYVLTDGDGGTSANYDTTVTVSGVNDAPVNTVPGAQTVNEDTPLALSGVSVTDVDGNLSTVQLGVGNGTLTVTLAGGATISAGSNSSGTLTLSGSQADINATLATLVYQGGLNYNGADTLTVTSTDSNNVTDVDTVAITVTPVNDVPTDLNLSANTVAENAANGTVVGTVTGTDPDAGDTKTYSFTDSAGGRFAINSATGQITVANGSLLNYEAATSHSVTVRVTDSGGLTYDETFTINLTNVNETPTDLSLSANTVAENAANGTVVGTITGSDPDAGDTKSYSFTDSAGGRFAINSATGVITVANGSLLDYESATSHSVTVRVTDSGGLTYDETFTINLTNVNEAPTGADATVTVNEDSSHTLTTANFGFSDVDPGDSLSAVRIDSLPAAGTLTLSGGSVSVGQVITVADIEAGHLVFTPAPDANGTGYTSFSFSVRDSGNLYDTAPNTLTVNVTPVNDAPINTVPGAQTVAVDTPLAFSGLSVSDVDGNLASVQLSVNNGTVAVTLSGAATISSGANGTATITFTGTQADINATLSSLTYQGDSLYTGADTLTVLSTDSNGATDTDTVAITVSNNAPTNILPAPQTVPEDTPLAISGISVADADGNLATVQLSVGQGTLGVTLSGGATISAGSNGSGSLTLSGTQAALNATLASLTYQGALNFSGLDTLTIASTDALGTTDTGSLAITVTPVNDAPTAISVMPSTVAENAINGTVVGSASTTDPDAGDTHTYQLLDSAGGRFSINSATGVITVADGSLLDYEAATSHTITVRTTDAGGLVHDQSFSINLTDVNEVPTDLNLSANTVVENAANGTVVGTITGSDPDAGDTKSYSFTDSAGGRFAINSATGVITVANGSLLDYESATSHSVTVRVTDSGGLTYDETFTINLTNINEAPTDLNLSANTVAENAANGTVVGTITGSDPDAGDTKSYSFTDSAGGRFAINSSTGQITVANSSLLDYETATGHNVTVRVTDAGGLTYDETFTINVTNVNETPTDLALSANTVAEDAANGTVVGTITGSDPDAGDTKSYSFTDSAGGRFAINSATGVITVANGSLLDYESATSHNVTVRVTDSGGLTYDETFTINLTNVNETPTDLSLSANTVAENAANGTVVGTVSGTDPDSGDTKTYSFTDSAGGRFAINSATGVITVANGSLLNYEAATSHSVTVRVTDSGGLTYDETFTINLTNVNETPTGADATVTINEDSSHTLTTANFGFSDVDPGDSLSAVRIDSLPAAGTLTLSGGSVSVGQVITVADIEAGHLVFTPAPDANGTGYTSFSFSVRDSGNLYDVGPNTLTFDVTAVNDAPVNTVPGAQTVAEDQPLTITGLSVTDLDGNLLSTQLSVTNGTLWVSLAGGATISAGANDSGTLTLSGTQAQINAALATLTYQGTLNYNGADTLTVTSTDSNNVTDVDTVAITVMPVNDPTVVTGGTSGTGNEDTTLTGTLTATDVEGLADGTVFSVSANATNGTASIDPATGLWSYTPNADFNGADSFTVTITDDAGNTATQVISVTVTPVVDLTDDSLTTAEDTAISANVLTGTSGATADSFEGTPVLTSVTQGANGSVTYLPNGTVTYQPNGNFTGTDSFTYTITSGGVTETATVTVTVTAVDDPTVVTGGTSGSGTEDTTITNTLTATDVEGLSDGTVFTVSTNPANGTASIDPATGLWSYMPTADFNGSDSFTVTITDDAGNTSAQVVSVTVTAVNDAPTDLSLSAISIAENAATGTVVGTVTSTDPDAGDTKTYSLTDTAGGRFAINVNTGVITVADGSLLNYEAAASHSVTVQVTDSAGQSYSETFTIQLTNVNEGPTDVRKENGGGPPFLHSNWQVAFEGNTRPSFLSQINDDTGESEGRVPDDVRKPVEWRSQPAPLLDALRPDRTLAGRAHDGDGTKAVGSKQERASAPSPRTVDETAVDLDAANAARPELEQVPQPPTAETENVPDDSGGLGVPMAVGLAGAVLQGQLGKKEKMTTLTGQNPARDRQPAKEQHSEQPSVDDQVVPPRQP